MLDQNLTALLEIEKEFHVFFDAFSTAKNGTSIDDLMVSSR